MRVNLQTAVTEYHRAVGGDLAKVADREFSGLKVWAELASGTRVFGEITGVTNAGFRGIEVHIKTTEGYRRTAAIAKCVVVLNP